MATARPTSLTLTITATGVAQPLATSTVLCHWFTVYARAGNIAAAHLGDKAVDATNRPTCPLAAGDEQGFDIPSLSTYDLSQWYIVGTQDDVVDILYVS